MGLKIGPLVNWVAEGISATPTVATSTTPGVVSSQHPVSNLLTESMESVCRWNVASAAHNFVDVYLGTNRMVDTFVIAGLTVNKWTRVRIRYAFAPSWPWVEVLQPNGVVSTQLNYTLSDLQDDPDNASTVSWPTHGGAGTTITDRFQFPTPTLSPVISGDEQIVRVRTGGFNANAHPFTDFELYEAGVASAQPTRGAFKDDLAASQASGGRVVELWFDADDISAIADLEVATPNVAGNPSAYNACSSVRWYVPTSDAANSSTTTDWIDVLNDTSILPGATLPGSILELAYRRVNVVVSLPSPVEITSFRVEIDPHSRTAIGLLAQDQVPVELAHVGAGESLELGFAPGASTTRNIEDSLVRRSSSGLPFTRLGARRRELSLALRDFNEETRRKLEFYFQRRQGLGRYMWAIPNGDDASDGQFTDSIWGTQESLEPITYAFRTASEKYYRTRLRVTEARDD